jgi:hypothetical protein
VGDQQDDEFLIECPRCGRQTSSLKCYTVPRGVLFLIIHISWKDGVFVGCPSCMRGHIAARMAYNLIPANLTWPIFASIWGFQIARSYTPGHSADIRRQLARSGAVNVDVFN